MFNISCSHWSWDSDLQIILADVRLVVDGELLIDEPLCVDVGLPALLYSVLHDVEPYRWAEPDEWKRMPFFCCGCGDPECRAFSFRVRHMGGNNLEFTELEERREDKPREQYSYIVPSEVYRQQVVVLAKQFLSFIKDLAYAPYYKHTVNVISELVEQIESEFQGTELK